MKLFTAPVSPNHISVPVYLNSRLRGDPVGVLEIARFRGSTTPSTMTVVRQHVEYGFRPNYKGQELLLKATKGEKSKRTALEKANP